MLTLMALEVLDFALVLLCFFEGVEGSEVALLAGGRVLLS